MFATSGCLNRLAAFTQSILLACKCEPRLLIWYYMGISLQGIWKSMPHTVHEDLPITLSSDMVQTQNPRIGLVVYSIPNLKLLLQLQSRPGS